MRNLTTILLFLFIDIQLGIGQYTTDTLGCVPFLTNFTSSASSTDVVVWDFGDGVSSNLKQAEHVYTKDGIFKVTLKINGITAGMQTLKVLPKLNPEIMVDTNQGCAPLTLKFKSFGILALAKVTLKIIQTTLLIMLGFSI
jgi:phage baseplate assembly protein gpV